MIGGAHGAGGAAGAIGYALTGKQERGREAEIVGGNLGGRDGRELVEELTALTALRPDIARPVAHYSLSAKPGEQLSPAQWGAIGEGLARHMGHDRAGYVVIRHGDTDHQHIHVIASRVDVDGRLVSDRFERYRIQAYAREVERAYQLERVPSSWEKGVDRAQREPSRAVTNRAEQRGEEAFPLLVRRLAGDDFKEAGSWEDLTARLAAHDLRVERGLRGPGLVVTDTDGVEHCKASEVGRLYSRANLEQRLGSYDAFLEWQQQREQHRAEPVRLVEQHERAPIEQRVERGDAGRISAQYGELAVPGAGRDAGRPSAGGGAAAGREPERGAEPGRGAVDRAAGAARGSALGGPGVHDGREGGGGRQEVVHGADHRSGGGAQDRGVVGADRAQLGGGPALPGVGGSGGAGAGAVAGAGASRVGEGGPGGRGDDERGPAGGGAHRGPGDPALSGPANPALAAVRDRGGDGLGALGTGALPADRAGIERALTEARRQAGLHETADQAARAHQQAYAQLYRDPAAARAQVEAYARSAVGPEVTGDLLRRTPHVFGELAPGAARQVADGWRRDLTDAILTTGRALHEADAQRPRTSVEQVTAHVQRFEAALAPFLAQDRAQEAAREMERELKRMLGLDRDRGRGGR